MSPQGHVSMTMVGIKLLTGIVSVFCVLTYLVWQDPETFRQVFPRAEDLPEAPVGESHV